MLTGKPLNIAIIGGGASGALTVIQLLQNINFPVSIKLINKDQSIGRGFAYSTNCPQHLLNVRTNNMSLFPDKPNHFIEWAKKNNIESLIEKSGLPLEDDFLPRMYYGDYIHDTLNEAISNKKPFIDFEIVQKEAFDMDADNGSYTIKFTDQSETKADKVVLAIGNFLPTNIPIPNEAFYGSASYIRHPYDSNLLNAIKPDEEVLIIGTGLTSVDVVLQLKANGIRGKITAISRNGYLPHHHVEKVKHPVYIDGGANYSLHEALSVIRKEIKAAGSKGMHWPNVIDALRPFNQKLWIGFSDKDKKLFVRKLSPAWNISRHRMAGAIYNKITALLNSGNFEIVKGGLKNLTSENGRVRVDLNTKDTAHSSIYVDRVINCSGPQTDYEKVEIPLLKNLVAKGIIGPDPLRLGINATPDGAIISRSGATSPTLFTLGPPLRGILWESIAMPEIREQAEKLALILGRE